MNHIQSPRTCDASIEEEILAKGLTAPRITPEDIEANIVHEMYFTAGEVFYSQQEALHQVLGGDWETFEAEIPLPLTLLTFCVLTLRNGFTVTGESACASPENFDNAVGEKVARANAVQKVWPLMGYVLKEHLHRKTTP